MIPAPVTDEMVAAFNQPSERGNGNPEAVKRTFAGPTGDANVEPCEAVVHTSPTDGVTAVVRVPLQLEPGDLQKLLSGGTVWLSMWGGLAPFAVEVVAAEPSPVPVITSLGSGLVVAPAHTPAEEMTG